MFQSVSINSSYKVNLQIPKSQKGEKNNDRSRKLVMRNIIYAVETGGQVYGQKNYADFTEAIHKQLFQSMQLPLAQDSGMEMKHGHFFSISKRLMLQHLKNMILPVLLQILPKQTGQTTGFPKLLQRLKLL